MLTSSTFTTNAAVSTNLPYDPVKAFAPVSMLARGPMILAVGNHTPYKSVAEVIAAARAKKGDVTYGSAGIGSINQMAAELLNTTAKVEMTHVPYKGAGNAITDLIGGQLQMMFASFPSISGQVKAGKVRALAVTSPQKSKFAPDLPTVAATVPGLRSRTLVGRVRASRYEPPALVQRLNAEIRAIAESPDMQERFAQEGADPAATMSPAQFATYVSAEIEKWRRVAKDRNIKAE
jgi:tripartite-type tricarboxylate transporter receptor subunit TctC